MLNLAILILAGLLPTSRTDRPGDIFEINHETYRGLTVVETPCRASEVIWRSQPAIEVSVENWLYVHTADAKGEHRFVWRDSHSARGQYQSEVADFCTYLQKQAAEKLHDWRIFLHNIEANNLVMAHASSTCVAPYVLVEVKENLTLADGSFAALSIFEEAHKVVACPH